MVGLKGLRERDGGGDGEYRFGGNSGDEGGFRHGDEDAHVMADGVSGDPIGSVVPRQFEACSGCEHCQDLLQVHWSEFFSG